MMAQEFLLAHTTVIQAKFVHAASRITLVIYSRIEISASENGPASLLLVFRINNRFTHHAS